MSLFIDASNDTANTMDMAKETKILTLELMFLLLKKGAVNNIAPTRKNIKRKKAIWILSSIFKLSFNFFAHF